MEKLSRFKIAGIFIWVLLPLLVFGQSDSMSLDYTLIKTFDISSPIFTTDQLRNVYTVTNTNEVIKYSPAGQKQFRYNNNTLGNLTFIDATDPFNLLLFYLDFRRVILLDRNLTETGVFDLFDLDVIDVPAVGISSDNNLWIYDDIKFILTKIDRNGDVILESNNLNLLLEKTLMPNFILERNNILYLNDPEVGILVFDLFGNYTKTIDIKGLKEFQIIDQQLIYWREGNLNVFNLKSLQTRSLDLKLPSNEEQQVRIEKDRLYVRTGLYLKIYQIDTKPN
jgi:hypothetical protein